MICDINFHKDEQSGLIRAEYSDPDYIVPVTFHLEGKISDISIGLIDYDTLAIDFGGGMISTPETSHFLVIIRSLIDAGLTLPLLKALRKCEKEFSSEGMYAGIVDDHLDTDIQVAILLCEAGKGITTDDPLASLNLEGLDDEAA